MIAYKYNIQNGNPNLPKLKCIELTMLGNFKKEQHSCKCTTFNKDVLHFSVMSHLLSKDILQLDSPTIPLCRFKSNKEAFFLTKQHLHIEHLFLLGSLRPQTVASRCLSFKHSQITIR